MDLAELKEINKRLRDANGKIGHHKLQLDSVNDRINYITVCMQCSDRDEEILALRNDLQKAIDKKRHVLLEIQRHEIIKEEIENEKEEGEYRRKTQYMGQFR
tara:strand:- start:252 stop:557 length:306 start_codon:yes stop_codon:yes gene_type:complete